MGYYNPIYIYGVDRFLDDAMAAGIDGLIVVDLPPEMDDELCIPALKAGLNFIRLATPTTDDKRLPKVLENTSGFVYYVSMTGITGSALADTAQGRRRRSSASRATPTCRSASASASRRPTRRASSARRPTASSSAPRSSTRSPMSLEPKGETTADPAEAVATLVSGLSQGVRVGPPCCCRIVAHIFCQTLRIRTGVDAMNWITNYVRPKINSMLGRARHAGKSLDQGSRRPARWCSTTISKSNQWVIPASGHHMKISAKERLKFFFDDGDYEHCRQPEGGAGSAEVPRPRSAISTG